MSGSFQKSSAGILASVLIGLIILSFMFTGYYRGMGLPHTDVVATVDREQIKAIEFQRALAQRMEFFRQMTGGKDLSPQQIEQFGIKESVMQWLIEQKLFNNFAARLGLRPGQEEVAHIIQDQAVFSPKDGGGRFDVNFYKYLLAQNGLTPAEYEKSVSEGLTSSNMQSLINDFPVSHNFLTDLVGLQENALKIRAIQLKKDVLKKFIPVSGQEIEAFLKDEKNLKRVEAHFQLKKDELDRPEQVKARHILLRVEGKGSKEENEKKAKEKAELLRKKLTPENFAKIADQETQDPSGKGKGGDLGWFGKGAMVPEFEHEAFTMSPGAISNPIKTSFGYHIIYVEEKKVAKVSKLDEYKVEMAKELIQDQKKDSLKSVEESSVGELKVMVEKDQKDQLDKVKEKYGLTVVREKTINPVDAALGGITIEPKQLETLFGEKPAQGQEKTFVFNNVSSVVILTATPVMDKKVGQELEKQLDEEKKKQQTYLANQLRKTLLDYLHQKANIKTFSQVYQ